MPNDLFFYCTLGVILGGRIGYAAFYKPELFASADVFKLWEGGMSFQRRIALVAISRVARRGGLNWLRVCDYIAVNVLVGYMLGRLANRQCRLWPAGRKRFPAGDGLSDRSRPLPRHPSQLYQAGFEGLMLGCFCCCCSGSPARLGLLVAVFTIGMGLGRFLMEFFREPDAHLAYVVAETGLSRGQWLSLPMIGIGLAVLAYALLRPAIGSTRAGAAPAG